MGACYSHQQEKNLIVFEGRDVCECISQWNESKNSSAKGAIPQEYHFKVKDQVFKIDSELNSQPNHPDWQGFLISDVLTPLKLEMWILHTTDQAIQASQEKRIRSIEKLQHNNILSYYYHMKSSFKLVVFRETVNNQQNNSTNNNNINISSSNNNIIPASLSGYISRNKISSNDCFELCDDLAKGLLFMQDNNINQSQPSVVQGNTSIKTTSIPQASIITVSDLYVIQHTLKIDPFFTGSKEASMNLQSSSLSSSSDILRLLTIRLLLNLPQAEETNFNDIYQILTSNGKLTNNSKNTNISLGFLKTTPIQLKDFINWNINPILTLRPNIQEIEKELDILRKDALVVQYINQLYLGNNQISQQDEIQEDHGQQQQQSQSQLHQLRQRQSYSLINSSISSQILPPTPVVPLLSVHNPSTSAGVIRKQSSYNPEEILKTKFQFFEETYEITQYLGATQYSILFRVDNINKKQQKSLMLKLSKQGIQEDLHNSSMQHPYNNSIEEEYNILKNFHCKSIIRVYSMIIVKQQFPGIIMSLPNTDLREYLISSQKFNIAETLLDYLENMIQGVHELHVRSVMHNNLSFKAVCLVNKEAVLTNLEYATAPQRLEKEINQDRNDGLLKEINNSNMNESNGLDASRNGISNSSNLQMLKSNPFNNSNSIVARSVSLKTSKNTMTTTTTNQITKLQTFTGNNNKITNPNNTNVIPFINEYSAPEVRDQIYCDYASDVYSLGLLVLSSLCNVSQEKLRRVTETAYNPLLITSDQYTSHIDSNIKRNNIINNSRGLSMQQSSRGLMQQQSTIKSSLRDILGQKCPVEIINGFEQMIAKNPEDRGQCSDYIPIIQQLKSLPHVIEYINVQNKLARFI